MRKSVVDVLPATPAPPSACSGKGSKRELAFSSPQGVGAGSSSGAAARHTSSVSSSPANYGGGAGGGGGGGGGSYNPQNVRAKLDFLNSKMDNEGEDAEAAGPGR